MSPPQTLYLPDGRRFTVTPVFGGMGFRAENHSSSHHLPHPFPIGWMTVLHTEEDSPNFDGYSLRRTGNPAHGPAGVTDDGPGSGADEQVAPPRLKKRTKPFHKPTLHNDTLFLSSISLPSSAEYKPAVSQTREIAMMLWITLYWYFQQPAPDRAVESPASRDTPASAKPLGEWKICIRREGVLRGRNLIPKLERMGLIASEDTSVGTSADDGGQAWDNMFVSRRMFWQIPPNLFLFTSQPVGRAAMLGLSGTGSGPGSPRNSRPSSPRVDETWTVGGNGNTTPLPLDVPGAPLPANMPTSPIFPIGPYFSSSHLPTYFPPPPLQYTFTKGIRHPLRPKPPRMGEVFYTRFIDSVGQYLSFRVASCSGQAVPYLGPVGPNPPEHAEHLCSLSDQELLQSWFDKPRVKEFWGSYSADYLDSMLCSGHSFPVIGLWDGVPFGYFEVYWVKEDILGRHVGSAAEDWDRGIHILVGEEWSRGRVPAWLTSLVHWCFTTDCRTMNVCLEPRVDNKRVVQHLDACGFAKEKQVSFPHKQAWFVRLRRDYWEGPAL